MKNYFKAGLTLALFAGLGLSTGCSGNKRVEGMDNQAPTTASTPVASGSYTVHRGDSLWAISGKSKIYGDPYAWPLLFKANRDTIQDPDILSVSEVLKVDKGVSADELAHARDLASKTPKYVPHAGPRATLPLNYF